MRPGRPLLVAALGLLWLAPAACKPGLKNQDAVVTRRLDGEPKTLNGLLATSNVENDVLALLSRNLLDYDASLKLVPGIATVTPDAGHKVFTVALQDGVRWEDGSPVTSADVAYTMRALVDPKTPALSRRAFFEGFEKVETPDARTARVTFSTASPTRLDAFVLPLLPAREYEGKDVTTHPRNRQPLANGPYRLARWGAGQTLELTRNTQFQGPRSPAEKVVFRVVPETAPAFQALLTGAVDEMRLNTAEQKRQVDVEAKRPDARVRPVVFEELAYTYIGWDNRHPLFADRRVRRALTMLIDREAIGRTLYAGLARPANGPVPPGLWSHDPALAPWPHDPAAAAALLSEAGFRPGKDGVLAKGSLRFEFELAFGSGSDLQRQMVEVIQQAYRAAGIAMTPKPMEWAAFITKSDAGELPAGMLALSLDPNPDMIPNWHSSQVPPNGFNSYWYRSAEADALMDRLRTTFDRDEARKLYAELQRVVHEDEPVSFLHNVSVKWGVRTEIHDVGTSPIGLSLFWPGASAWRPVRGHRPA